MTDPESRIDAPTGSGPEPAPTEQPPPPAIRVRHLWHRYGNVDVLKDIDFAVAPGEIFGFIGPNGAGKTTTIRIMATLLEPLAGRVEIDGIDVAVDPDYVRRIIGYMPDHAGIYQGITVRDFLEFFATAHGVRNANVVDTVLELTGLEALDERLVATLSKGMKQRLQLARILLHDPKVLVLDEPASDLDPRARIEIRDLLLELRELGKTIFLSSHILTELSDICTSVGILERGRLVVAGPIQEIASRLEQTRRSEHPPPADDNGAPLATAGGVVLPPTTRKRLRLRVLGDAETVVPLLAGGGGVHGVEPGPGGRLLLHYVGDDRFVADVVRHLVASGVGIVSVEPEGNELERIFLEVTQGELQ